MECPICGIRTSEAIINLHLDKGCPPTKRHKSSQSSADDGAMENAQPRSPPPASSPNTFENTRASQELNGDSNKSNAPPKSTSRIPLAEQMRPSCLDEYIGQDHLVGKQGMLRILVLQNRPPSMILWGPSGVGKTTFARILARETKARFIELSATTAGVNDIKQVVTEAKKDLKLTQRQTILFLDEIHRFNRAQQDSLLPGVERGDIILVGATTENPSFKLQGALMSRCRVFTLKPLNRLEMRKVLDRALQKIRDDGLGQDVDSTVVDYLADVADGDARAALNMLETAANLPEKPTIEVVRDALKHVGLYDQQGDMHYDLISAFHKSVRGSDADAALYYLARMLRGGEDPLYICRRMIRIASEDVGLADDSCLPFATATHQAVQQVGMPEADMSMAHCAVKLARAPKSVEVYKAFGLLNTEMDNDIRLAAAPVPMHIRNAPTQLMDELGYGKGYKYNPKYINQVKQKYLPDVPLEKWLGRWKPTEYDNDAE